MSSCDEQQRQQRQGLLLLAYCLFAVATCFGALYPKDLWLQHSPTVVAVFAMAWCIRRTRISHTSFVMVLAFWCLHAVGARYIYSYVPYDDWSNRAFGVTISSVFGFHRNHYDRLVHFSFGLLFAFPFREVLERTRVVEGFWSRYFAFEFVVATSALYELAEWLVAIMFAPDWADRYLGQQGDIWDAQKDMALATCGAVIALLATNRLVIRRAETHSN